MPGKLRATHCKLNWITCPTTATLLETPTYVPSWVYKCRRRIILCALTCRALLPYALAVAATALEANIAGLAPRVSINVKRIGARTALRSGGHLPIGVDVLGTEMRLFSGQSG